MSAFLQWDPAGTGTCVWVEMIIDVFADSVGATVGLVIYGALILFNLFLFLRLGLGTWGVPIWYLLGVLRTAPIWCRW
jgi:hypothetical protein